jgi:hypothetical protein
MLINKFRLGKEWMVNLNMSSLILVVGIVGMFCTHKNQYNNLICDKVIMSLESIIYCIFG